MLTKKTQVLVTLLSIVVTVYSCSNNHHASSINFKTLNDSLTISNGRLSPQNDSLYKVLEAKLADEKTSQNAKLWFPKAQYLQYRTKEINKYIEANIFNVQTDSSTFDIDSLYEKLGFYKTKLLSIDPDIYATIHKNAEIITHDYDSIKQNVPERFNLYFSSKSKDEKLFILNQTLNNIKITENEVLVFCNNKIN